MLLAEVPLAAYPQFNSDIIASDAIEFWEDEAVVPVDRGTEDFTFDFGGNESYSFPRNGGNTFRTVTNPPSFHFSWNDYHTGWYSDHQYNITRVMPQGGMELIFLPIRTPEGWTSGQEVGGWESRPPGIYRVQVRVYDNRLGMAIDGFVYVNLQRTGSFVEIADGMNHNGMPHPILNRDTSHDGPMWPPDMTIVEHPSIISVGRHEDYDTEEKGIGGATYHAEWSITNEVGDIVLSGSGTTYDIDAWLLPPGIYTIIVTVYETTPTGFPEDPRLYSTSMGMFMNVGAPTIIMGQVICSATGHLIPDVEIFLLSEEGFWITSTITDANGEYVFDYVPIGNAMVQINMGTLPPNYFLWSSDTYHITAYPGGFYWINFYVSPMFAVLSGTVTNDETGQPIPNATVRIYEHDHNWDWVPINEVLTDSGGNFYFGEVPEGSIRIVLANIPEGYIFIDSGVRYITAMPGGHYHEELFVGTYYYVPIETPPPTPGPVYTPMPPTPGPVYTPGPPTPGPVYTPMPPTPGPPTPGPVYTPMPPTPGPVYTPGPPTPGPVYTPMPPTPGPVYTPVPPTPGPVYTPVPPTPAPVYTPGPTLAPAYTPAPTLAPTQTPTSTPTITPPPNTPAPTSAPMQTPSPTATPQPTATPPQNTPVPTGGPTGQQPMSSPTATTAHTPTPSSPSTPAPLPPAPLPNPPLPDLYEPVPDIYTPNELSTMSRTHHAYISGYPDGYVRPGGNITRAEVATIFFRLMDDNYRARIWSQQNPFPDVQLNGWFNNAISTLASVDLLQGFDDGYFRPNQSMTRAEFAAVLVRVMGYESHVNGYSFYPDTTEHWAEGYISKAHSLGWTQGYSDRTFRPNQPITRAEVAAIVNRALGRLPASSKDLLPGMVEWPDNMNDSAWYYLYMQEATNSHYHTIMSDGIHETWTGLLEPRKWWQLEHPESDPYKFASYYIGQELGMTRER